MKNNILHNFIKEENNGALKSKGPLEINRFSYKVNSQGTPYFLYPMDVGGQQITTSEGQISKLHEHHLSFYEKQKDSDPNLSQYHYTACFIDGKGQKCKLHVYFDPNDVPLHCALSIAKVEQPIDDEIRDSMVQFALVNSQRVMRELRDQHATAAGQLESKYSELEVALSRENEFLGENYQRLHLNAMDVLQKLAAYHFNTEHYKKILCFFNRVAEFRQAETLKASVTATVTDDNDLSTISEVIPERDIEAGDVLAHPPIKIPLKPLIKAFMQARSDASGAGSVLTLVESHEKVSDLFVKSIDPCYVASPEDLKQIYALFADINSQATKLVLNLLLMKNASEAELVCSMVQPIPLKWVLLAIKTGNAVMLNFALKHGAFPIDTLVIQGKSSPVPLVQFCFEKGASHLDCLSVLIAHKASLFCTAEDGLPIAHHMLNVRSPLRKALVENTALTLSQPRFFGKLIQRLQDYLAQHDSDESIKAQLVSSIASYECNLGLRKDSKSRAAQYSLQQCGRVEQKILSHQSIQGVVETIKNDPCYQAAQAEFEKARARYFKKLDKRTSLTEMKQSTDFKERLELNIGSLAPSDIQTPRTDALRAIKEQTEAFELKSELVDVQERLKKFKGKTVARLSREIKKDITREKEIITQLNGLVNKYASLAADPQDVAAALLLEQNRTSLTDPRNISFSNGDVVFRLPGVSAEQGQNLARYMLKQGMFKRIQQSMKIFQAESSENAQNDSDGSTPPTGAGKSA